MREQARHTDLVGAVIGALELENLAPSRRGPRESLAVHGGLGAGCAEAQPLAGGAEPADLLRECKGVLVHAGEVRAERRLAHDRLGHLGPRVSHEHRTPADGKIEVSGAGRILDHASLAPADDRAELGGEIEFSIGACGKHPQRSLDGLWHIRFGHGQGLNLNLCGAVCAPERRDGASSLHSCPRRRGLPHRPNGEKRPGNVIGCAVKVVRIVTGEIEDPPDEERRRGGGVGTRRPPDRRHFSTRRPRSSKCVLGGYRV